MTQSPLTGATERIYNNAALPPPWQRGNTPHFANDPQTKKRKLKASRDNVSKRQANPPASQVTTPTGSQYWRLRSLWTQPQR